MKNVSSKALATLLLVCICFASVFAFTACSNPATAEKELTKVTVSEVTHSVFYAPQYVAYNLGFFTEEGIDLEIVNSQGADKVMTAVLSNQVDIGFAGPEAAIYVYNEGKADYTEVFAQITQRDGSFLVGREPEENFEWTNLKGKHVLPGRKGGVPYMTLEYVLKQNGLDTENDLDFDNSISYDLMNSAFVNGTGDYVTMFEPAATVTENEGKGYIVASVGEAAGEIPYTAYFAKKSYLEKNADLIQHFVNAIYKGQVWVDTHTPAEIAEALLPSFPDTDIAVLEKVAQRYKEIGAWKTEPSMTEESFNKLQEVMTTAGELTETVPYDKVVNNTFANKVQ
ncbi:MAG: ABC transporter substrate-binding protein [Clostridia bacterium]|nr:ABC transporter substrate-binding protein [Clostridia bacterium]